MIIYGKNPIQEAVVSNQQINKIYLLKGKRSSSVSHLVSLARQRGIPIREIEREKMRELVGHDGHQGMAAEVSQIAYSELDDIFQRAEANKESSLIAILDEIQDPHNLGAIIRSAEAFGFHGIIIPKDRSVGLTETVVKTSAGAVSHLPIVRVTNLARTIDELKNKGVWIAGTDQAAAMSFYQSDLQRALAIVIGSEGKGMRQLTKSKCDFLVKIPLIGKVNSLNASVAAAIIFCEARRQRQASN